MPECLIKVAVNLKKFQFQSGKSNRSKVAQAELAKVQQIDVQELVADNEAKERAAKEEEENKKKSEKAEFDSNMAFLNSLAFFMLFLIIFSCDLAFWLSIGI
jgi:hypothetical protein